MSKVELTTIESITANDAAAVLNINNNFKKIEEELDNTLSRDGTVPNYMETHLDLNGYKVINSAEPENDRDVVNKKYVDDIVGNGQQWAEAAEVFAYNSQQYSTQALQSANRAQTTAEQLQEYTEEQVITIGEIVQEGIDTIDNYVTSKEVEVDAHVQLAKDWAIADDGMLPDEERSSKSNANLVTAILTAPPHTPVNIVSTPIGVISKGDTGKDGLTTSVRINDQVFTQVNGEITLPTVDIAVTTEEGTTIVYKVVAINA